MFILHWRSLVCDFVLLCLLKDQTLRLHRLQWRAASQHGQSQNCLSETQIKKVGGSAQACCPYCGAKGDFVVPAPRMGPPRYSAVLLLSIRKWSQTWRFPIAPQGSRLQSLFCSVQERPQLKLRRLPRLPMARAMALAAGLTEMQMPSCLKQ